MSSLPLSITCYKPNNSLLVLNSILHSVQNQTP
jgi:hypothetical protein